jgi:hypothetical protein
VQAAGHSQLIAGTVPCPDSEAVCGDPGALSDTTKLPPYSVAANGLNVTLNVHDVPIANVKDVPGHVPMPVLVNKLLITTPLTISGAVPVELSVIVAPALVVFIFVFGKVVNAGEREAPATGLTPVPVRVATCGDPAALSVTVMLPP